MRLRLEDGRVIEVRLLEVDRGRARLGFTADRTIQIERAERWPQTPPPAAPKEG